MKINRKNLQEALEYVKPGLAGKEMIAQSTSFAFINGHVVTYNDEISVRHPVPNLGLEGAIEASSLYDFMKKIKGDEFDMEISGSEVKVSSGRTKAGFTLSAEVKLPLKEEIRIAGEWITLPEKFNQFLGFAMTSCSIDRSLDILTYVNVDADGIIQATDTFRVCRCDLGEPTGIPSFLIRASSAEEVVKLNPIEIQIDKGGGWVHFRTESETIISCRLGGGKYKDVEPYCYVEGSKVQLPRMIESAIDRAMVFAKRPHILDEEINFTFEKGKLHLSAGNETGWIKEEFSMGYEGKLTEITVTPYLLKSILKETQDFTLGSEKLKFQGEGWIYVFVLKERK